MLLTQALALAGADALACTLVKTGIFAPSAAAALLPTGGGTLDRDPVLLVLECGLLGAVLAGE